MATKLIAAASAAAFLFAAADARGQGVTTRDSINPWLDCGIGAAIFPDDNLELAAAFSNLIWDLGTTAVISAQSSPDTCEGTGNVTTALFIERTYETLEAEIARGHGENLSALAALVEASDEAAFVTALRAQMQEEVSSETYASLTRQEKAQALYFAAYRAAL